MPVKYVAKICGLRAPFVGCELSLQDFLIWKNKEKILFSTTSHCRFEPFVQFVRSMAVICDLDEMQYVDSIGVGVFVLQCCKSHAKPLLPLTWCSALPRLLVISLCFF